MATVADTPRVLHRPEIDEPDAIRELTQLAVRELLREPRLAATADAGEREKPRVAQQAGAIIECLLASDEAGSRVRQVVGIRRRYPAGYSRSRTSGCERSDEAGTRAGDGRNGVRSEQLAQAAHLHLQVVFLDDEAWPDRFEEFRLVDDTVAPLDQRDQQVESPCAERRRGPVNQQLSFGRPQFAAGETILIGHCVSSRV